MNRLETFINKSEVLHLGKYDYSLVDYINNKTKVKIICCIHGVFESKPNCILSGRGCPECANISRGNKNRNSNWKESFIKKHGDRYDYSKVIYKDNRTKVEIVCSEHGSFFIKPNAHITQKQGCRKCGFFKVTNNEEFILESNKLHNNKYDYSNINYENSHKKVKIICSNHGHFFIRPNDHLKGQGCSICKSSRGETKIINILEKYNIEYFFQHKFENCLSKRNVNLKFDFYLPKYNTCIEYDGEQHFKSVEYFGGYISLIETKERDEIKNKFCLDNKIKLLRIPFNKYDDIEKILIF